MITCPNCGRDNADNFNFCLDCGTELGAAAPPALAAAAPPAAPTPAPAPTAPPMAAVTAPVAPAAPTAPAPVPVAPTGSLPPPPVAAATTGAQPAADGVTCPKCGHGNSPGMKFCGECGSKMDGSAPAAPPEVAGGGKTMFLHAADMSALTQPKARLITIDQSGKEGMTFNLTGAETLCGRTDGSILFFDDPFVSPQHCVFLFAGGKLSVVDKDSINGVFIRVRQDWPLEEGDLIRVGRQLFKLQSDTAGAERYLFAAEGDDARIWGSPDPQSWARLVQVLEDGKAGEVHLLRDNECRIGREVGDILLPNDGFVSASHCALAADGGRVILRDLGSSNGTYVRIKGQRELQHDDFILVGNQMLKVELR